MYLKTNPIYDPKFSVIFKVDQQSRRDKYYINVCSKFTL